jgi:hypothetical protein
MKRTRVWSFVAGAAVFAAGAVWWLNRDAAPLPRSGEARMATAAAVVASDVEPQPPARTATPAVAMPPAPSIEPVVSDLASAPTAAPLLRDEIAELDRRARAGDASAACRIAGELHACERARMLQPYSNNIEAQARYLAQRSARPEDVDRQIDDALRRQAENAAALARCEGIDERRWPPPARYFGLAAQAGHRPSMLQFLGADRYRADQLFRDPELIPLLRANGPRYFRALIDAGDPELLQRWAMSPGLPHDVLFEILPPPWNEPGLAAAMQRQAMLARGVTPPEVPVVHAPTPEQIELAKTLFARHFASTAADRADLRQRRAASPYDVSQFRCDEAAR